MSDVVRRLRQQRQRQLKETAVTASTNVGPSTRVARQTMTLGRVLDGGAAGQISRMQRRLDRMAGLGAPGFGRSWFNAGTSDPLGREQWRRLFGPGPLGAAGVAGRMDIGINRTVRQACERQTRELVTLTRSANALDSLGPSRELRRLAAALKPLLGGHGEMQAIKPLTRQPLRATDLAGLRVRSPVEAWLAQTGMMRELERLRASVKSVSSALDLRATRLLGLPTSPAWQGALRGVAGAHSPYPHDLARQLSLGRTVQSDVLKLLGSRARWDQSITETLRLGHDHRSLKVAAMWPMPHLPRHLDRSALRMFDQSPAMLRHQRQIERLLEGLDVAARIAASLEQDVADADETIDLEEEAGPTSSVLTSLAAAPGALVEFLAWSTYAPYAIELWPRASTLQRRMIRRDYGIFLTACGVLAHHVVVTSWVVVVLSASSAYWANHALRDHLDEAREQNEQTNDDADQEAA